MGLALIIEHDETGPVAVVGERLIHHGFELDTFRVLEDRSDPICTKEFPDPNVYDLVVVLGSERSVCDKGPIESWIDREIDLVQTAHRSGKPVLGLCFGGQVLAAALGGEVDISPDSIISESVDREAEARQQAYRLVDWFLDLPDDQCP